MVAGNMSDKLISIHAPREGGDAVCRDPRQHQHISIHAPREGGDGLWSKSMLPSWISIHAPREGGDVDLQALISHGRYFNPRPPRGGRP